MTIEEAISWFENRMKNTTMPGSRGMFAMAINALRAQKELESNLKELESNDPLNGWISVKDRMPVTGNVLATDGQIIITAPSSSVRNRKSITHWMPLPELPKEGAENDRNETR